MIAALLAIGIVLSLISGTTSGYAVTVSDSVVNFIICAVIVACMFYVVYTERANFLIPYLVYQVNCNSIAVYYDKLLLR